MSRSFRSYQEGEKVQYKEMTIQEVKEYLVIKGSMMEESHKDTKTKVIEKTSTDHSV